MDKNKTKETEELIGISEAAKILGVSISTLRRWDKENRFRPFKKMGKRKDRKYKVSVIKRILTK